MAWAVGKQAGKRISKETLNHRGIIEMVSGLDVYQQTPEAYRRAYEALGIDIVNRVPLENAPAPIPEGETRLHPTRPYRRSSLGVYDTVMRHTYACRTPEEVWTLPVGALRQEDLLTPVPHPWTGEDIRARDRAMGDAGVYYPMLYTTLFMWAVEVLGWEVFMVAAMEDKDRFHRHFLVPCVEKSRAIVTEMALNSEAPFVVVHDDLASSAGPMFPPAWYDEYIFPHYPEIWAEAKRLGKKVVFCADGNMTAFLPKLIQAGVDGFMFETPATRVEAVIEHFGRPGRFFIGGIDTVKLTRGSPDDVRAMVFDVDRTAKDCPGFAMGSCGGIHGDIPLRNLEAYFGARAEIGVTPADWRTRCRA